MIQSDLTDEMLGLTADLTANNIEYALCGGLALAFYGQARFTQDIDLLIRPEDRDKALDIARGRGFVIEAGRIPLGFGEQFPLDIYRVSKVMGEDLLILDLLLTNPDLLPILNGRVSFVMQGQPLNVVSLDGLAQLKRRAGRPQDLLDLKKLGFADAGDKPND